MTRTGQLQGFKEYLAAHDGNSIFDHLFASGEMRIFHIHPGRLMRARVTEMESYTVTLTPEEGEAETLAKLDILFIYTLEDAATVTKLIKVDKTVQALTLAPAISYKKRQLVKNRTLFPLMEERVVLFFTLIDGSVIRGLVTGFSRYEIGVSMKGGVGVTLLRHSLYDIRDKDGLCYLKSVQEKRKDWRKSSLFVTPSA